LHGKGIGKYLQMEMSTSSRGSLSSTRTTPLSSAALVRHLNDSIDCVSDEFSNVLSVAEAKEELEERIKILHSYFSHPLDAIDNGNFKTPDKRVISSSLPSIFGSTIISVLISDYCDLLVKDAVYSQTYFQVDSMLLNYLKTKICSPIAHRQDKFLVTIQTMEEFLGFKRNEKKSDKAKMKAQLLIDLYNNQMKICIQHWASIYFNPSLRISMNGSTTKELWRRNKDSCVGKFLASQHVSSSDSNETIFGMSESLV
jgi:uncharacterized UPF0160 family protein